MTWKVSANLIEQNEADGTDLTYSQRFKVNSNSVVRAIRTWVVLYNNPTFTNMRMRLYENRNGVAGKVLATSTNSFVTADLLSTEVHGLKGIYFTFADVPLLGTEWYHAQILLDGYTFSDSSLVGWVKGFPDPEYREGLALTYEERLVSPYRFAVIGADL